MADSEKSQHWFNTVPGILTGVAAFITAISGLILALNQAGVFSNARERKEWEQKLKDTEKQIDILKAEVSKKPPPQNPKPPNPKESEKSTPPPRTDRAPEKATFTLPTFAIRGVGVLIGYTTEYNEAQIIKNRLQNVAADVEVRFLDTTWNSFSRYVIYYDRSHYEAAIQTMSLLKDRGIKSVERSYITEPVPPIVVFLR